MKKILIFSLNYYPFVGGAEVAVKEITDRISPEKIEFHLIAYRFDSALPRDEHVGNVRVHRVGFGRKGTTLNDTFSRTGYVAKIFYVPFAALEGILLHRKHHFDGAWAMMNYMVFPLVLMRMVGLRLPYVLTLQEGDPFEHVFDRMRIRFFSPLLFYGIRHASAVQAISTFLGAWARRCGFTGTLEIIPNGVDIERFAHAYALEDVVTARSKMNAGTGDTLLVTTSRLVHKNGIDDVIRALPLLPEQVRFVVYGIGPDEEKLRALAKESKVENRVHFMGHIAHGEMPLALRMCDIFIRPSRSEGMGNSFIEAMAAGLPVIATQEGGIADFLFDANRNPQKPTTGWAVDKDCPVQIAEQVKNILAFPAEVAQVKKTARDMAVQHYDWNTVARAMYGLFDRVFEGK
ncbi:MAG: glycosyltransferase family 4 protein [Minisyncoccia bacterium]